MEMDDSKLLATELAELVEGVWTRTRVDQPRLTVGYAGQITERTGDQPVKGAGDYQRQVKPVTA
jgi:hypothetical protein